MVFHGHEVNLEQAIHAIAIEYAKRELDVQQANGTVATTPQAALSTLSDSYFEAYGWLCGLNEDYFRTLMENRYRPD